jgi:hypothetical protein
MDFDGRSAKQKQLSILNWHGSRWEDWLGHGPVNHTELLRDNETNAREACGLNLLHAGALQPLW